MITLTGKKVSEGIVIGKLVFYKRDERENRRIYVKDVEKEVQRFQKARQKAMAELKELYVDPFFQHQGLGLSLLKAFLSSAKQAGMRRRGCEGCGAAASADLIQELEGPSFDR